MGYKVKRNLIEEAKMCTREGYLTEEVKLCKNLIEES